MLIPEIDEAILNYSIFKLHLSNGTDLKLKRAGIETIRDLLYFEGDLLEFMGRRSIEDIKNQFKKYLFEWSPVYFLSELGDRWTNEKILKASGITPKRKNGKLYITAYQLKLLDEFIENFTKG